MKLTSESVMVSWWLPLPRHTPCQYPTDFGFSAQGPPWGSCEQAPVEGSQKSRVHEIPSSHASARWTHSPGAKQPSIVHGSPSSQSVPWWVHPIEGSHWSRVQGLASAQSAGWWAQMSGSVQVSVVHGFPSSQVVPWWVHPME